MNLADLSALVQATTFNCIIPLTTLISSLLLKTVIMVLQFARMKISGIIYHTFVAYKRRFLNVVQKKPATTVVARDIGKKNFSFSCCLFSCLTDKQLHKTGWWMVSLLPAVSCTAATIQPVKPDEENRKNLIFEADKLYNEHSYKKLRDLLLQYKVWGVFSI